MKELAEYVPVMYMCFRDVMKVDIHRQPRPFWIGLSGGLL